MNFQKYVSIISFLWYYIFKEKNLHSNGRQSHVPNGMISISL